ncbi:MAG: endolytic transglycosylase MltG [Bifidobacterium crudilactis]|nr:endolytic transglycosylase MltG [Bifidobacterium crudilactis]
MEQDLDDFFTDASHLEDEQGRPIASSAPPLPPKSRRDMRRKRVSVHRKRLVAGLITLLVVALIGGGGWFVANKLSGMASIVTATKSVAEDYTGSGEGEVDFTVETGQSADKIADNLVKADIVKSAAAFTQAVAASGVQDQLFPGVFELKLHMKAADVVKILTDSSKAGGFLEVRSGDKLEDVITKAATLSGIKKSAFDDIVNAKGTGILPSEANGSFEGWLEPGSYNVKKQGSASDILKDLVDKRIAKLDSMNVPTGAERERILNVASIAEAEVNQQQYYSKVTRVIDNRIAKGMTLGMDTTVAYGAKVSASDLTNAQLSDTSNPYNTRVHTGLPPTPISNPGDNAIKAALNPEDGDWLYFVTVNLETGETKFTADASEFDTFVKEYKQWESSHGQE